MKKQLLALGLLFGITFGITPVTAHTKCIGEGIARVCDIPHPPHNGRRNKRRIPKVVTYKVYIWNNTGKAFRYRHNGRKYSIRNGYGRHHDIKINQISGTSYKKYRFNYDGSYNKGYQGYYVSSNKADTHATLRFYRKRNRIYAKWVDRR